MKKHISGIIFTFSTIFTVCLSFLLAYPLYRSKKVSLFLENPIYIDPGHGGRDNGANYGDVLEDEINLKIATALFDQIVDEGGVGIITRTDDYDLASLYATNRKREDLEKRVEYINRSGATIFVSIHLNAFRSQSVYGPMVYHRQADEKSKQLGIAVLDHLNTLTNDDKTVHSEDYYLFRNTWIPGILIECGFISNSTERKKLLTEDYQRKLAASILEGIKDYLLLQRQN